MFLYSMIFYDFFELVHCNERDHSITPLQKNTVEISLKYLSNAELYVILVSFRMK